MEGQLWEILVPKYSNNNIEYPIEYHNKWDDKVKEIAGGLTILRSAKGYWTDPEGKVYKDAMIPVRIRCDEQSIDKIIDLTLTHYDQEAVLAYLVSEKVKLVHRNSKNV